MKIISILNQKGGVGKTTTTINLAAGLGIKNYKVLVIDIDPQSNTTMGFDLKSDDIKADSFSTLIKGETSIEDTIIKTSSKNVDLLPASINLAGADVYIRNNDGSKKELYFKEHIDKIKNNYDFILIDCPPTLGTLNRNSLAISDSVLIPMQTEYFAFEGLTQLLSTISIMKRGYNRKLKVEGILVTMHNDKTILNKEIEKEVKKFFSEKLYDTKIPRNIKLAEAPSIGKTIFEYDKHSIGAKKYMDFVDEFISKQ